MGGGGGKGGGGLFLIHMSNIWVCHYCFSLFCFDNILA